MPADDINIDLCRRDAALASREIVKRWEASLEARFLQQVRVVTDADQLAQSTIEHRAATTEAI